MAEHHVGPMWFGYLHLNPLRKLLQNPDKILGPYVNEAMIVADIGCAMGFFSLPLAKMVGANGKVICVDIGSKNVRRKQDCPAGFKLSYVMTVLFVWMISKEKSILPLP